MVKQSKSILARLLANENITVQRGNYPTAYFDVEKRVLGLPLWEDFGKDVEDLLIGHEVGHALFTPADGWHDSPKDLKIPRSFLNVVEDIRIERKIQSMYPGLVNSFKKGYKVFSDQNFFKTEGRDLQEYSLIDRINLKAKLRDLINVDFSLEEKQYVDKAFSTETWEDVLEASKALYEFMKDQEEDEIPSPEDSSDEEYQDFSDEDHESESSSTGSESDEKDTESGGDAQSSSEDDDDDDKEGEEVNQDSVSQTDQESNQDPVEEEKAASDSSDGDDQSEESDIESETDMAFRENESKLELKSTTGSNQPKYLAPMSRFVARNIIVPYPKLKEARIKAKEYWYSHTERELSEAFKDFESDTKKVTSLLAKEFEMRKAAFRTIRASESNSGTINVNKLHSYKYEEDIFQKVTNLADAQSHGMVMLVDFSGSMQSTIGDVINQTLSLISFCKKVNIPFEVYSFTTRQQWNSDIDLSALSSGEIDPSSVSMLHLLSSSFGKTDYQEAYRELFYTGYLFQENRNQISQLERLGGTPLSEALMVADLVISDFKRKHGIQKTNLVVLSDGEGSPPRTVYERLDPNISVSHSEYAIDFNNKIVNVYRQFISSHLVKELSKKGINTTCFYITSNNRDINSCSYLIWTNSNKNDHPNRLGITEVDEEIRKGYKKERLVLYKDTCGYNQFFVIKASGKSLETSIETLEISPDASKSQIKKAFSKYSKSKKTNRVLATKFAEAIA